MIATADRRAASVVGRCARLELVFASREGRTVLTHAYAEPPFRVGRPFREGEGLHLILASSAPGIFAGDRFEQVIRLETGARVRLTSQSALQVHPSPSRDVDAAILRSRYHVEGDAVLSCHWDPVIPFADARFDQKIDLQLSESATLLWSDALMNGRAFAGHERWAFESVSHELRVTRAATLEYLERYRLEKKGLSSPLSSDACYFGTTLLSAPRATLSSDAVDRLHADLNQRPGVDVAVDRLEAHVIISRLMAETGVPFHAARAELVRALQSFCDESG